MKSFYRFNFKSFFSRIKIPSLFFLSFFLIFLYGSSVLGAVPADQLPVPWSQIKWDHTNVSGWAKTATLSSVYIAGSQIYLPYDKTCVWPGDPSGAVNANSWIIANYKGQWIASTWDFMRICQTSKAVHAVGGGAMPSFPDSWVPAVGSTTYFFVSGLARYGDQLTNVQERSNVVKYIWYGPTGYPPPVCTGPPVIKSFTASPGTVQKGDTVTLSWNIAGEADNLTLEDDKGASVSTKGLDLVVDSVDIIPIETTTLTLTASNDCLNGAAPPSVSVKINVVSSLPFVSSLLLYENPVVTTGDVINNSNGVNATLTGTINANSSNRSYNSVFEFGPDSTYGDTLTGNPATVSGLTDTNIDAVISGLSKDTQYHYRLKAVNGSRVESGADKVFKTPADPTPVTDPATNVTDVAATLNGNVNPGRSDTTVTFEYTQKVGGVYSSTPMTVTASPSPLAGDTAQAVSADVVNLTSLEMYRFRVKAVSDVGTVNGAYEYFTTAGKPAVSGENASAVTDTTATLSGTVNPSGDATVVTFLWSEASVSPGYDNTVVQNLPAGFTSVPVSTDLTSLTAGTLYKFKIEAVNTYGGVFTAGTEFTTDSAPVVVTGAGAATGTDTAAVAGTVSANGAETTVTCYFGNAPVNYSTFVAANESPVAFDAQAASPVTCGFTGLVLNDGTTYYYNIKANNGVGGDIWGTEGSFTYSAPPPI